MRPYLILKKKGEEWEVVSLGWTAHDAASAIANYARSENRSGTYVAFPARNWKLLTATVESEPRVKVTEADA